MYIFVAFIFMGIVLIVSIWLIINSISMLQTIRGGAYYVPAPQQVIQKLLNIVIPQPNQLLIDLGSGDGRVLRHATKVHNVRTIGYEIAWWPRMEAWLHNQLLFILRPDLRNKIHTSSVSAINANVAEADYVFLYASPHLNDLMAQKLHRELPVKSTVITLTFPLPGWQSAMSGTIGAMRYWIYKTQLSANPI